MIENPTQRCWSSKKTDLIFIFYEFIFYFLLFYHRLLFRLKIIFALSISCDEIATVFFNLYFRTLEKDKSTSFIPSRIRSTETLVNL